MRIMAIDYGDAHTGVAISDPTGLLAGYTATVNAYTPEKVIAQLRPLIEQYHVEQLVLGCPKNMDGTEGPRAEKSRRFQAQLEEATGLPVALWDERRTTIDAHTTAPRMIWVFYQNYKAAFVAKSRKPSSFPLAKEGKVLYNLKYAIFQVHERRKRA